MDFAYSDEQQAAIELARQILTDHCTPQKLRALDLARALPGVARRAGVRLLEVRPLDDSLESAFRELVR